MQMIDGDSTSIVEIDTLCVDSPSVVLATGGSRESQTSATASVDEANHCYHAPAGTPEVIADDLRSEETLIMSMNARSDSLADEVITSNEQEPHRYIIHATIPAMCAGSSTLPLPNGSDLDAHPLVTVLNDGGLPDDTSHDITIGPPMPLDDNCGPPPPPHVSNHPMLISMSSVYTGPSCVSSDISAIPEPVPCDVFSDLAPVPPDISTDPATPPPDDDADSTSVPCDIATHSTLGPNDASAEATDPPAVPSDDGECQALIFQDICVGDLLTLTDVGPWTLCPQLMSEDWHPLTDPRSMPPTTGILAADCVQGPPAPPTDTPPPIPLVVSV